jgi:hypothetical protein
VLVNVSVEVVIDVLGIVNIDVVAFEDIEEYSIWVEKYNGLAVTVMFSLSPRRNTAG